MRSFILMALLGISGLILAGIGGAILFVPEQMHAMNGVVLEADPSLLSEIRAPGGLLLAGGFMALSALFVHKWMRSALLLSALFYGSYGLARLVSFVLDGMPSEGLVAVTGLELVLGTACLIGAFAVPRNPQA